MGKYLIILLLIITSCHKDSVKPANLKAPESMMMSDMMMSTCTNLSWLMDIEDSIKSSGHMGEIYSYVNGDKLIFEIKYCLDCTDGVNTINNCEGMVICQYMGMNMGGMNTMCGDVLDMTMGKKLVWKN